MRHLEREFIERLIGTQNGDGGWGAVPGRISNTEATALASLALREVSAPRAVEAANRGRAWLVANQHPNGSWPITPGVAEGSWTTPLAILAVQALGDPGDGLARAADWLLALEGRTLGRFSALLLRLLPEDRRPQLDPELQGWPWRPGSFSWVEPTATAILALKKLRGRLARGSADERIRQGELFLADRMCRGGGWNYGNSMVFGEALPPYAQVTAVALIALQDRSSEPTCQRGLEALAAMLDESASGLALAWSILCLMLHGRDVHSHRDQLARCYSRSGFLEENRTLALALLALGGRIEDLRV